MSERIYTDSAIQVLDPLEMLRKRSRMYLGETDAEACVSYAQCLLSMLLLRCPERAEIRCSNAAFIAHMPASYPLQMREGRLIPIEVLLVGGYDGAIGPCLVTYSTYFEIVTHSAEQRFLARYRFGKREEYTSSFGKFNSPATQINCEPDRRFIGSKMNLVTSMQQAFKNLQADCRTYHARIPHADALLSYQFDLQGDVMIIEQYSK